MSNRNSFLFLPLPSLNLPFQIIFKHVNVKRKTGVNIVFYSGFSGTEPPDRKKNKTYYIFLLVVNYFKLLYLFFSNHQIKKKKLLTLKIQGEAIAFPCGHPYQLFEVLVIILEWFNLFWLFLLLFIVKEKDASKYCLPHVVLVIDIF